ncbi:glycine betaine ABC transporter substrate-binding protein, partial [Pseudomonas aeruginosa]|uniref:glycine betaine ABC transporter substrate-binding protein n=1 Tax=Pseudomonas aeruginosa TaxID=287 RepID=UPI001FC9E096
GLFAAGLAQAETLRIGGKTFTEQRILTAITAQFLQKRGYDVTVTTGLGSTLARAAQESGQLDIVWEYTGSSLIVYNHIDEKLDAAASYRRVKQLDEAQGLVWLKPTRFNNTYALAMPEEQAERLGIQSVSDLARVLAEQQEAEPGSTHLFAMDPEFAGRPDGLGPMSELYAPHFTRNDIRQMDAGLVYTALKNRQVFLGLVYTTDGRLKDFKLRVLKDDKQYFPFYNAAPVVRKEVMQRHPEFATLFDPIIERLDDATMQALNARVDIEQQTPQKVAADFLREHHLLDDGQAGQGGSQ